MRRDRPTLVGLAAFGCAVGGQWLVLAYPAAAAAALATAMIGALLGAPWKRALRAVAMIGVLTIPVLIARLSADRSFDAVVQYAWYALRIVGAAAAAVIVLGVFGSRALFAGLATVLSVFGPRARQRVIELGGAVAGLAPATIATARAARDAARLRYAGSRSWLRRLSGLVRATLIAVLELPEQRTDAILIRQRPVDDRHSL